MKEEPEVEIEMVRVRLNIQAPDGKTYVPTMDSIVAAIARLGVANGVIEYLDTNGEVVVHRGVINNVIQE